VFGLLLCWEKTMLRSEKAEAPDPAALRQIAIGAMARTTGSPLTAGNGVRILHDAPENCPACHTAAPRPCERCWEFGGDGVNSTI
jgi:hypothetical protein